MLKKMYFDLESSAQYFEIKLSLRDIKQGNLSMIEYFDNLTGLWWELGMFDDHECFTSMIVIVAGIMKI